MSFGNDRSAKRLRHRDRSFWSWLSRQARVVIVVREGQGGLLIATSRGRNRYGCLVGPLGAEVTMDDDRRGGSPRSCRHGRDRTVWAA